MELRSAALRVFWHWNRGQVTRITFAEQMRCITTHMRGISAHFVTKVLDGEWLFVVGGEDEFEAVGKQWLAEGTSSRAALSTETQAVRVACYRWVFRARPMAGFEDPNYFSRAFRDEVGITPKRYQLQSR